MTANQVKRIAPNRKAILSRVGVLVIEGFEAGNRWIAPNPNREANQSEKK